MKPDSRSPLFLPLAAAVFLTTVAAGWFLPKPSHPRTTPPGNTAAPAKSRRSAWKRHQSLAAETRSQVAAVRKAGDEEHRILAAIALARSIPASDFDEWLDDGFFDFRNGPELTIFRKILEERWKSEDPEGFVAWCLGDMRGMSLPPEWASDKPQSDAMKILSGWALDDPERLAAYFSKHPNNSVLGGMLKQLSSHHPDAAARLLASAAATPGFAEVDFLRPTLATLAKNSPASLESILPSLPGPLRYEGETLLSKKRLKESFSAELERLSNHPEGWRIFERCARSIDRSGTALLEHLPELPAEWRSRFAGQFRHFVGYDFDPAPWLDADLQAAGFTRAQARQIRAKALSAYAFRKPEETLAFLKNTDLDPEGRRQLISSVFAQAENHPDNALKWFEMLDSESDLQTARDIMGRFAPHSPPPEHPYRRPESPEQWIDLLASKDMTKKQKLRAIQSISFESPKARKIFVENFRAMPEGTKTEVAKLFVESSTMPAGEIGAEAVMHLIAHQSPASETEQTQFISAASQVARSMVLEEAPAACEWVAQLPEGSTKRWTQKNMAAAWARHDPAAMRQWLSTLPPETRQDIGGFLEDIEK